MRDKGDLRQRQSCTCCGRETIDEEGKLQEETENADTD